MIMNNGFLNRRRFCYYFFNVVDIYCRLPWKVLLISVYENVCSYLSIIQFSIAICDQFSEQTYFVENIIRQICPLFIKISICVYNFKPNLSLVFRNKTIIKIFLLPSCNAITLMWIPDHVYNFKLIIKSQNGSFIKQQIQLYLYLMYEIQFTTWSVLSASEQIKDNTIF